MGREEQSINEFRHAKDDTATVGEEKGLELQKPTTTSKIKYTSRRAMPHNPLMRFAMPAIGHSTQVTVPHYERQHELGIV